MNVFKYMPITFVISFENHNYVSEIQKFVHYFMSIDSEIKA